MYQSLYRKYRPQNFDEVVGQKIIVKILKNVISKKKINHAYLFTGPRGTGKTSVAHIFAKTVNCTNLNDYLPCGTCVSCTQIKNKQSVDIIEIDAASNNGVDEIREIRSKVSLIPATSKYKVYIIDEVHMLTIGAFNALLKTLEEPPSHVIFILATTEPHKIPETILSRCQRFDFKKIDDKSMLDRLLYISEKENIDIEKTALEEIIRFSSGGLRDAISLLEQAIVYSDNKITLDDVHQINGTLPQYQLKELVINILDKNLNKIFQLIEKYDSEGKNFTKLVEEIILFLKNIILYKNIPDSLDDNISREIYNDEKFNLSNDEILKMISKINNYLIEMKNYNHPKLLFELLMIALISNERENVSNENNDKKNDIEINVNKKNKNYKDTVNNNENITKFQNNEDGEMLEKIIKIRINNTFVKPSKILLNNIKKEIEVFRKYVLDEKYGKIATLILDAKIAAASENNLVFVYYSEGMKKAFNQNIVEIEKFIENNLKKKYKVIAVHEEEWAVYRSEFKSKTKKYEPIEETKEIEEFLNLETQKNEKQNDIESLFSDIIEYKN